MNKLAYVLIPLFTLALLSACGSSQPIPVDGGDNTGANAGSLDELLDDTNELMDDTKEVADDAMDAVKDVMDDDDKEIDLDTPPSPPTTMDKQYDLGTYEGELKSGKTTVTIATRLGDMVVEIDADIAPLAATNFIVHAQNGYYTDIIFPRVIPEFMIQGGDPQGLGIGGESIYGRDFEDEPNDEQMVRGVLAMANRGPNTNGSQFFITQADAPWLTGNHTIFGKVTSGMDVVDAIANAERDARDKPTEAISMQMTIK
jgi:peptidyl-prolyl cis-trans isomerase B (cyclophilin B)